MKALVLPDRGNRPARQPRMTAQAAAIEDGRRSAPRLPAVLGSFGAFPDSVVKPSRRAREIAFTAGAKGPAPGGGGRGLLGGKKGIPEGGEAGWRAWSRGRSPGTWSTPW